MERAAYSIDELAQGGGGPKRAKLYAEISQGRLRAVKIGRATRVLAEDWQNYLASLPAIEPKAHGRRHGQGRGRQRRPAK
jgi:hypothetical protein